MFNVIIYLGAYILQLMYANFILKSVGISMSVNLSQYQKLEINLIKTHKESLIQANIPFMRINRSGSLVPIPIKDLDMVLNSPKEIPIYTTKDYTKYVTKLFLDGAHSAAGTEQRQQQPRTAEKDPTAAAERDTIGRMVRFQKMSIKEKINTISDHSKKVNEALKEKTISKSSANDIIESQTDASLILKSTIFENFKQIKAADKTFSEIQSQNKELMKVTKDLVVDIVKVLSKSPETQDIFENLQHFSEGGTSAHSNRVFVMFTDFIRFYNKQVNEPLFVNKMRKKFSENYKDLYQKVLDQYNGDKEINRLEDAIESGLGRLSEAEMLNLPVAALLHDIGKIKDIDYFESDNARDYERIQRHLFNGFYLITKMIDIPDDMAYTIGFHHEYYGLGYGPFKSMYDKKKDVDYRFRVPYVMSYNVESVLECRALGYFPAKVIEAIDVYDALMDPARKYRKGGSFTSEGAIELMEKEFVQAHTKLDPIVFCLFKSYVNSEKLTIYKD